MIIGNGLLARAMAPYLDARRDLIVLASGVSNSTETRQSEFDRESALLEQWLRPGLPLLYFGSCGVLDPFEASRPYIQHKRRMEDLVLRSGRGRIVRLPQVVGCRHNPHTLTNFMRDHILSGAHFTVWSKAERNLVDIDDVAKVVAAMVSDWPGDNPVVSIAAEQSTPMPRLVGIFEDVLGRKANCTYEERGNPMVVDASAAWAIGARLGIDFSTGYTERVIWKYYGKPASKT